MGRGDAHRLAGSYAAGAALLLLLCGCDQFAVIGLPGLDAGQDAVPTASAGDPQPGDALDAGDLLATQEAGAGDGGLAVDGSTPLDAADAGACDMPPVAVCNPITNEGCPAELAMQCAVDLIAPNLAGYCIFSAPEVMLDCFNSGVTESCPPSQACVLGQCAQLCFCDSQCPMDLCCNVPVGEAGFMACGDC